MTNYLKKFITVMVVSITLMSTNCFAEKFNLYGIDETFKMTQVMEHMIHHRLILDSVKRDFHVMGNVALCDYNKCIDLITKFGVRPIKIGGELIKLNGSTCQYWAPPRGDVISYISICWSYPYNEDSIILSVTMNMNETMGKFLFQKMIKKYGKPKIHKSLYTWNNKKSTLYYLKVPSVGKVSMQIVFDNNIDKVYKILQETISEKSK